MLLIDSSYCGHDLIKFSLETPFINNEILFKISGIVQGLIETIALKPSIGV